MLDTGIVQDSEIGYWILVSQVLERMIQSFQYLFGKLHTYRYIVNGTIRYVVILTDMFHTQNVKPSKKFIVFRFRTM